jgi:uncharacterized protein (DUF1499 family)
MNLSLQAKFLWAYTFMTCYDKIKNSAKGGGNGGITMNIKRIFIGIFRSIESTGERAKDPLLKSHFYKLSKDKMMDEVSAVIKKLRGYKIVHEVPNVGEIVLEKKTSLGRVQDITITVCGITPVSSSVDIYSASRGSLGDLGSNYRTILEVYGALDRALKVYKDSK